MAPDLRSSGRSLCAATALLCACGDAPASIEFLQVVPEHPKLGELATLTFRLTDYRGVPQAGAQVAFGVAGGDVAGVTLSPRSGMSQKGSGEVTVQLLSTAVTSVMVEANAGGKIATTPPIAFAGGYSSGRQLTFQCGELAGAASGGVHAIGAFDPARHLIAGVKLKCSAHVADRSGDGIAGVQIAFLTEAGSIVGSETSSTDVVGNATVLFKTSLPLPVETAPGEFVWSPTEDGTHTGEYLAPLWMEPFTWSAQPFANLSRTVPPPAGTRWPEPQRRDPVRLVRGERPINNPRDNLVTMIAVTRGEEGFDDVNLNRVWDEGEPLDDLTEPFIDADDDGTCGPNERYIDSNGDGEWDGKNGRWDANTDIWVQERVLWTGIPYLGENPLAPNDFTGADPTVLRAMAQVSAPLVIGCDQRVRLTFFIADPWFNSMARNSDTDGCEQLEASGNVKVAGVATGRALTYPPVTGYGFAVNDNLERTPSPMTNVPGCFPPVPFSSPGAVKQAWFASVKCVFTASPEDGFTTTVVDTASGTIFNNLPVPCSPAMTAQGCEPFVP